jgi:hypothetical protein
MKMPPGVPYTFKFKWHMEKDFHQKCPDPPFRSCRCRGSSALAPGVPGVTVEHWERYPHRKGLHEAEYEIVFGNGESLTGTAVNMTEARGMLYSEVADLLEKEAFLYVIVDKKWNATLVHQDSPKTLKVLGGGADSVVGEVFKKISSQSKMLFIVDHQELLEPLRFAIADANDEVLASGHAVQVFLRGNDE